MAGNLHPFGETLDYNEGIRRYVHEEVSRGSSRPLLVASSVLSRICPLVLQIILGLLLKALAMSKSGMAQGQDVATQTL